MAQLRFSVKKPERPDKFGPERRPPHIVLSVHGGPSRIGSSYYKRLIRCPREHALYQIGGLRTARDREHLTVGWLFHLGLEVFYRGLMAGLSKVAAEKAVWERLDVIAGEPGYEDTWTVVERCLGGYFDHYRDYDHWRILAVEETLEYLGGFEYSARLDLVVEILDPKTGESKGTFIIEHKTARYVSEDLLLSYQLDMQILGQVWLFMKCVDLSRYPHFRGVIVNITTKHKAGPQFERVEVCPSQYHLAEFERQMRIWYGLRETYTELGHPKHLGACAGFARGYTTCDYYTICHSFPTMSVDEFTADVNAEPPFGYVYQDDWDVLLNDDSLTG